MAIIKQVLMCVCAYVLMSKTAWAHDWKTIDTGLSYTFIEDTHVFETDPKIFKLSIITAKDIGEKDTTAQTIAKKSKAILVINGGYFDENQRSLGLLVRDGKILNPLHPTAWWAVFYILDKKSAIVLPLLFQKNFISSTRRVREGEAPTALPLEGATRAPKIEMAIQVGPRLVVKGKVIKKLKASQPRRRSGLCIRKNGNLVIAMAEGEKTMEEFAKFFQGKERKGGINCPYALNLDGGRSSQIYIHWNGFRLDIPNESRITNAIAIFPRNP